MIYIGMKPAESTLEELQRELDIAYQKRKQEQASLAKIQQHRIAKRCRGKLSRQNIERRRRIDHPRIYCVPIEARSCCEATKLCTARKLSYEADMPCYNTAVSACRVLFRVQSTIDCRLPEAVGPKCVLA